MAESQHHWQESIDPHLMRRLLRSPQSGVIDARWSQTIVSRTERMTSRLPLLIYLAQRQASLQESQLNQPPIVYAQPLPAAAEPSGDRSPADIHPTVTQTATQTITQTASSPPTVTAPVTPPAQPTVIQAKFDPSATAGSIAAIASDSTPLNIPANQPQARSLLPPELVQPALPIVPTQPSPLDRSPFVVQTELKRSIPPSTTFPISIEAPREAATNTVLPTSSPAIAPTSAPLTSLPPVSLVPLTAPLQPSSPEAASPPALKSSVQPHTDQQSVEPGSPPPAALVVQVSSGATPPLMNRSTSIAPLELSATVPVAPIIQTALPQQVMNSNSVNPQVSQSALETTRSPAAAAPSRAIEFQTPPLDLDALADKVERKLVKRLVVERERRGQTRWR